MGKIFWALLIIGVGVVGHFDNPKAHIEAAVKNAEPACWTPLEIYTHVSLIAANRKGGESK